jgi:Copper transport outer membrane protein, MctB
VVNIRFHLVSLVAVFFALAIGIGVGSSVVRSGVLERTEAQLQSLDQTLGKRNGQIKRLKNSANLDLAVDQGIDDRFFDRVLRGTPVVVVKLPGADDRELRAVVTLLKKSQANLVGVVSYSARVRLGSGVDTRFAAIGIQSYSTSPDAVSTRLKKISKDALSYGVDQNLAIRRLAAAGFVGLADESGKAISELTVPLETRLVVVGSSDAKIKNIKPFVAGFLRSVVAANPRRVVALDSDVPVGSLSEKRKLADDSLVAFVRRTNTLSTKVATIDGSLTSKGVDGRVRRAALVILLIDGEKSRIGHYGTGPNATAHVPGQPMKR